MATFNNIDTFAELQQAITDANGNTEVDVINITSNITLTAALPLINESNSLTINGGGFTISGDVNGNGVNDNGDTRLFFVNQGTVNLNNLTLSGGRGSGGTAGAGGGGGLGAGGALFINGIVNGSAAPTQVTVKNVTFSNDQAIGGNGGASNGISGGGGFGGNSGTGSYQPGGGGGGGGFSGNGSNGTSGGGAGGNGGFFGNTGGAGGAASGAGSDGGIGGGGGGGVSKVNGNGTNGGNGGEFGGGGAGGASQVSGVGGLGGNGGFGGGGGNGGIGANGSTYGAAGNGGFGGGGGSSFVGGGIGGSFGGNGGTVGGGGGAGLGGAIFIRSGTLALDTTTFTNNRSTGGTVAFGGQAGQGKGGAIFVNTGATATAQNLTYQGNTALDAGSGTTDNGNIYGNMTVLNTTPKVQFSGASFSANEDNATGGTLTLTRDNGSGVSVAQVNITGGTATSGSDFSTTGFPFSVTFANGETSKSVSLPLIDDNIYERVNETVEFSVTPVTNAIIGTQGTASLTINSNEAPPTVRLSTNATNFNQDGGTAIVTATLSYPSAEPVTVGLTFGGTATSGTDYTTQGNSLTIAAGSTTGTLTLTGKKNLSNPGSKSLTVDIGTVTGGTKGSNTTQTLTTTLTPTNSSGNGQTTDMPSGNDQTPNTLFDSTTGRFSIKPVLFKVDENSDFGSGFKSFDGTPKPDRIKGSNLNDVIRGRTKNDHLDGQAGNDILFGGKGNDVVSGNTGNDLLLGNRDKDVLIGGDGDDVLFGGTSSDRLTGGKGKDTFALQSSIRIADRITDFSSRDDKIAILVNNITQLQSGQVLDASQFRFGSRSLDRNDYFLYDRAAGTLSFDADGNGSGKAVVMAKLGAGTNLNHSHIVIV